MTITREHRLAVANWIEGIDPPPILKHMKYRQRAGYSETDCCMMCALSLVSGHELEDREFVTRLVKTELPALGECFLIAVALWNATDQQYGPVIAALLRDDRDEAERRAVATQQRNGSGLWLSGVVRNQTGGLAKLWSDAQSHGQSGGEAWLRGTAQSHNQSEGLARLYQSAYSHGQSGGKAVLYDSAQSYNQSGGEANLHANAQSYGQSGGEAWLYESAQSHGQSDGKVSLYDNSKSHNQSGGEARLWDNSKSINQSGGKVWLYGFAESHNMRGGTLYVCSPDAKVINHLGGTVIWQEWHRGNLVGTRRVVKPDAAKENA